MNGYFPFDFITTKKVSSDTIIKYEVITTSYYQYLCECIRLLQSVEVEQGCIILSDTGEVIIDGDGSLRHDDLISSDMKTALNEMKESYATSFSRANNVNSPSGYTKDFAILVDEFDCEQIVQVYRKSSTGQKYIMGEFLVTEVIESDPNEPVRTAPKSRNSKTHIKKMLRQWLPKWRSLAVFDRESIVE